MLTLTLPWPPSVNTYWRSLVINRRVRVVMSEAGREYRTAVGLAVLNQRFGPPMGDRLQVVVYAYPPDRRQRDLDNLGKGLLDALTHAGVYLDDSQIDDLRLVRRDVVKGGRIVVHLTPLPAPVPERIGGVA